jgi:putative ATP-dependent endonuclease of OLD family
VEQPVEMNISRVKIRNFKSIRDLEFYPNSGLNALIGENNVGKSNIFEAINRLLGPRYPVKQSFTADDHFNRNDGLPIYIELDSNINGTTSSIIFDEAQERYNFTVNGMGITAVMRERLYSAIHLGTERKIVEYLPSDRWSLLGKLLLDINEEFKTTLDEYGIPFSIKFKEEMDRIRDHYLFQAGRDFNAPEGEQETNIQKLKKILQEETANQLNKPVEELTLDLSLTDPWNFYRTLQIIITDFGQEFQASKMGMGVQASLSIAILRAYGELKLTNKPPIFIDEPELYMHPQAQRNFYRILRGLSEDIRNEQGELIREGLQIFYSTHSPDFLDAGHFDEIFLTRRPVDATGEDEGTKIFRGNPARFVTDWEVRNPGKTSNVSTIFSLYQNALEQTADTKAASEAFFAKKIILVEGGTEALGLPVFFDAIDFNLDKHGISIVSVGGKTELDRFYRLYNEFGIPTYVVFDGDEGNETQRTTNGDLNESIQELVGEDRVIPFPETGAHDRYTVFRDNYEATMRNQVPHYATYETECVAFGGKPIKGKLCARKAIAETIPQIIRDMMDRINILEWRGSCLRERHEDIEPF